MSATGTNAPPVRQVPAIIGRTREEGTAARDMRCRVDQPLGKDTQMDTDFSFIVPLLGLLTLLAVCVFALISKARVERLRHDPTAPTSSLAKDSRTGGAIHALDDDGLRHG
jgi:hypothetical protein